MYRYMCLNVYGCATTSRPSSTIGALLIQKHERKNRDACRQAVHANGRGQAAPTTLTSSPELSLCELNHTRMPEGHFHDILSRTEGQPCKQMRTEARSTSSSRGSTWPSRRTSRSTRINVENIKKEYVTVEKEVQKHPHQR